MESLHYNWNKLSTETSTTVNMVKSRLTKVAEQPRPISVPVLMTLTFPDFHLTTANKMIKL